MCSCKQASATKHHAGWQAHVMTDVHNRHLNLAIVLVVISQGLDANLQAPFTIAEPTRAEGYQGSL